MLKHKMPNDAELIEILPNWLPTEELRKKVLVDNPSRLYGF
jgi:predicted TIM-barrel fold metal-dependent hydrolase